VSVSSPREFTVATAALLLGGLGGCLPDLKSGTESATNTAPTVSSVTLSPSPVYSKDILTASVTASDTDDDSLTMSYEWYVEGSLVHSGPEPTLDGATAFDKGDMVHVSVAVDDGTEFSNASSQILTVQNAPPTRPEVSIEPSSPQAGDPLRCVVTSQSRDDDEDSVSYTMSWTVDGVTYSSGGAWIGPSTTTWVDDTTEGLDSGYDETWQCTALPTDGDSLGNPATTSVETGSCDVDGDGYLPLSCGGLDCDDTNPGIHPGADELCENGTDENCNGSYSEGCPSRYFSCMAESLLATQQTLSCNFGELLPVDAIRVSVGCNDGETGAYTVSFDTGSETSFTGYCKSLHTAGVLASGATLTMHSGGGGDNLIYLDAWGFDYR